MAGGAPKPDEIVRPGGNPIGRPGTSPGIREVSSRDTLDCARELHADLTAIVARLERRLHHHQPPPAPVDPGR